MKNEDTIKLLKECDAGTKMAVTSINEVLDKVNSKRFKELLDESKEYHKQLGNEIHSLLLKNGSEDKEPNPIAKGMSWMKTNVKIGMNESDATIADLITDGCNMGVKSLNKYLNQYKSADDTSKDICNKLVLIEEQLAADISCYL